MKIKSLLITVVLATAILCSGGIVSATDNPALIAQLMAQIQALQSQLQTLQNQQGTTTSWCHTFNSNLGFANTGSDEISQLHTALQKENISYGADSVMEYGEDTAAAVVQLQAKYGIKQTGYVGPLIRAKLNSLYGCSTDTQTCTPNWQCTWGSCANGFQSQGAVDLNNCGVKMGNNIACRAPIRSCTPPATQPSITVTSPNGGETVLLGASGGTNDFRATWVSSNLSGNVTVYLNLADGRTCLLGSAPVSQGYFLKTIGTNYQCTNIPAIITPGQYKVLLNSDTPEIDSNSLFGIHDSSDNYFSIVTPTTTAPSITVISPNGGETITAGQTYQIRWNTNNISADQDTHISLINTDSRELGKISTSCIEQGVTASTPSNNFNAKYLLGNCSGFIYDVKNTGSYNWTVPTNLSGSHYLIYVGELKIMGAGDTSDNYFTIVAPTVTPINGVCGSANGVNTITAPTANLCLSGTALPVSQNTGLGFWMWPCNGVNGGTTASCNAPIITAQPTISPITITTPNGGEQWLQGSTQNITWMGGKYSDGTYPGVDITIYPASCNNGRCLMTSEKSISLATMATNSVSWQVGKIYGSSTLLAPGNYYIKICTGSVIGGQPQCKTSANYFSIVAPMVLPSVTITSPNGGEKYTQGKIVPISFSSVNLTNELNPDGVTIQLYRANNGSPSYVSDIVKNYTAGSPYNWTIPNNLTPGMYYIYISATVTGMPMPEGGVFDFSDNYFSVVSSVAINDAQNNLASIADVLGKIFAEVQAMLNNK